MSKSPGPRFDTRLSIPFLILASLVIIFFSQAASAQGVYFLGDAVDYFARLTYCAERLRAGHLALWNPYLSLGGSQAADPAAMAWYPLNLILFTFAPMVAAYNYEVLLHVLLGGSAMYLLARTWNLSCTAALLSGIVYAFNGFLLAHLQHLNILIGAAWLPLIFYFVERYFLDKRARDLLLAGVALGIQVLGGHTQIVLYGGLALAGYILLRLVKLWRGNERVQVRHALWGFGLVFIVSLSISAVYIIPFFELLQFTARASGISYDYATTFSLVPERLITFLFPFFFGGSPWRAESGPGSFVEMSAYVGILAWPLAAFAVARKNWRIIFLVILLATALVLALGRYTPLYELAFQLPLLHSVRAPARFLVLVIFAIALLAGFGLDVLRANPSRRMGYVTIASLGLVVTSTVIIGLGLRSGVPMPKSFNALSLDNPTTLAALAFCLGAAGVIALWLYKLGSESLRLGLTVAFVVVDLYFFDVNLWYNHVVSPEVYTEPSLTAQQIKKDGDTPRFYYWDVGETKLASYLQRGDLNQYAVLSRDGLQQSLAMRFGIYSAQGYGSEPPAYSVWLDDIKSRGVFDSLAARLIGMFGDRYVLTRQKLDSANLVGVQVAASVNLYRNDLALPRAFVAIQVIGAADQDAALAILQRSDFDPRRTVVIEGKASELDSNGNGSATIRLDEPEHIVIDTQSDSPGYLVLSDTFYPGWFARVDRQPVPIYRANALVRAVPIEAGAHQVEFVYDPLSVKIGAAISGLTIVALILFALSQSKIFQSRK